MAMLISLEFHLSITEHFTFASLEIVAKWNMRVTWVGFSVRWWWWQAKSRKSLQLDFIEPYWLSSFIICMHAGVDFCCPFLPWACTLSPHTHAYSESVVGVRQVWLAAHSESKAWDSPCTVAGGKIILFRVTIFSCHHLTFCPRARCFYLKVCFYLKGGGWAVCSSILPDTRMPHSLTRTDWISHLTAITFCQASPNPIAVPKPFLA